jgi:demethylmenaquinone methyltransferase/2-methoxy-6-polyprenyl-1,4-benzoquinol methylase
MAISKKEIQAKYQRQAKKYDLSVKLYRLIGLRIESYRLRIVQLLRLKRGDRVIEIGCGTGLNFPLIMQKIGPEGRLTGVDITPGMIKCAQEKVALYGWKNVELIQSDISLYEFPENINAVLSTGVFGYISEYDRVIEKACLALIPGGRLVILDLKKPGCWPSWLFKFYIWLASPFGVTHDYFRFKPWKSIERYFRNTVMEERYGGLIYISSGTAPSLGA